ncbi:DUF4363 family protein [Bacillus sp. Marseille-P3661]|uniref:DUF4363 family protein n=1 Tax=Bacillus sp. Marseille-P3661 TaxID=1936234 RepID=UPI0015E1885D|nr:DUF4363 family protein [Bacillus sp. Marseille-P3661]
MYKKSLVIILILLILSGCSNWNGENVFLTKINIIEQLMDQEEWNSLKSEVTELKSLYESHKWKIQLLGDEEEYEGIVESINRLFITIEEEDATEAKLELATIKAIINEIYSL